LPILLDSEPSATMSLTTSVLPLTTTPWYVMSSPLEVTDHTDWYCHLENMRLDSSVCHSNDSRLPSYYELRLEQHVATYENNCKEGNSSHWNVNRLVNKCKIWQNNTAFNPWSIRLWKCKWKEEIAEPPCFQLWNQLRIGFCHMTKCILKLQRNLERHSYTKWAFEETDRELLWISLCNQSKA